MKITSPFHSRAILLGISLALPATMCILPYLDLSFFAFTLLSPLLPPHHDAEDRRLRFGAKARLWSQTRMGNLKFRVDR
ncbi:hypothetical protein BDQ94DRAFT_2558 [Aspergillus welwitschiae]|uniref:Uncharacterized protein n=1 Tax=Aspergillus welwitschiae TaxID=1341132 RepID=A0A3F3QJM8_9EURO|nr:hypothetical protein BDQ94DRAFT_2558 [Aspergillus welwitschiae]RDH39169.1 hypothetical protein BDQ94DRAFT_2558 [Aspergillus welwitschiae]